jgi:hypothetical protein
LAFADRAQMKSGIRRQLQTVSLNAIPNPGIGRVQRAGLNHCYRAVRVFRSSRQFRIMENDDGTPARVRNRTYASQADRQAEQPLNPCRISVRTGDPHAV